MPLVMGCLSQVVSVNHMSRGVYRAAKRLTESICNFCRAPSLHTDKELPRLNKKESWNVAVLIGVTFSTFYFIISEPNKLS